MGCTTAVRNEQVASIYLNSGFPEENGVIFCSTRRITWLTFFRRPRSLPGAHTGQQRAF